MTAIVISLIIVTQSSHDASNLDPMAQEIFVTFWYLSFFLWASCRQVSIVDCSNGVFSSINRLRWTVKIMLSLLSNFWSRTIRTKLSAASLTLHQNDAVHVQLTSGTSSSNREEERPPEPITGFGSRAGTTNCDASGLGGFVRRYLSTQESEDNIELLPLYHVL